MGQTNVSADKAPIDPLRICIQAERFLFADEKPRSREVLTGPEVGAYVMLPCLVMEAFSVELYIKCLICLEDHPVPRFHHLKNLFDRLNGKTQKELAALWWPTAIVGTRSERCFPRSGTVPSAMMSDKHCRTGRAPLKSCDMHTRAGPPAAFTSTPCRGCCDT